MSEQKDFKCIINEIRQLIEKDVKIIINIVNENKETSLGDKINGTLFDSYMVVNNDIVEKKYKDRVYGRRGVYVFKMIDDYEVDKDFNKYPYSVKPKDVNKKKFVKDEILYVGKSNSLITRTHQHYSDTAQTPYSLKLGWDIRKELKEKSIMVLFFLKKEYKDFGNVIIPITEEMLHEKLKPLTGSPRI